METAALVASVLIAVVAVFQIALAFGAPARHAAWGGAHEGKLPTRLRVASGIAGLFFYPALIILVLIGGGVIETSTDVVLVRPVTFWTLTGLFILGALANFASRSKVERWWGPVSLGTAVCLAIIAIGL